MRIRTKEINRERRRAEERLKVEIKSAKAAKAAPAHRRTRRTTAGS